MKDIIKRIVISIISGGLIGYLAYLFFNGAIIVQGEFLDYNTLYYIILFLICLYLFVLFGIYPIHIKMRKITIFIFGLGLIIIGDTVLTNNPQNMIYVEDLFKLIGVILALMAWTDVLVTSKVQQKAKDKNIEVIEV